MPPSLVLDDDKSRAKYIRNPEIYLANIMDPEKKSEALQWLVCDNNFTFTNVDFISQKWLFETQQFNIINLANVHTLKLDSCSLTELPNFSDILRLKHLSLNRNYLKAIPTNVGAYMVEILEVMDNPIEEVDFDRNHFPQLAFLVFGSKQTKFVSFKALNQTVKGKLNLFVPEEYRKYLVRPNWELLGKVKR